MGFLRHAAKIWKILRIFKLLFQLLNLDVLTFKSGQKTKKLFKCTTHSRINKKQFICSFKTNFFCTFRQFKGVVFMLRQLKGVLLYGVANVVKLLT